MVMLEQQIEKKAKAEGKIVCDCIGAFLSITKQANGEHAIGEQEFHAWNERRNVQWVKVSDVLEKVADYKKTHISIKQLQDFYDHLKKHTDLDEESGYPVSKERRELLKILEELLEQ